MKASELAELYDKEYEEYSSDIIQELLVEKVKESARKGVSKKTINIEFEEISANDISIEVLEKFLENNGYSFTQSSRGNALSLIEGMFVIDLTKCQ